MAMNLVNTLKISTCILLVIALIWGVCAINAIRDMSENLDSAVNEAARSLRLAVSINASKADMYVAQRDFILASFMRDQARSGGLRRDFATHSAVMAQNLSDLQRLTADAEGEGLLASIQSDADRWQQEYRHLVRLCEAGDPAAAERHSLSAIAPIYQQLGDLAAHLEESNRRVLAGHSRAVANRQTLWIGAVMLLIFGACLGTFAYVSSRMPEASAAYSHDDRESTVSWLSREM